MSDQDKIAVIVENSSNIIFGLVLLGVQFLREWWEFDPQK
jgi:hypothetical protein